MTKFHILTPAYNCQEEIITTLYSIAGQSYKDWTMTIVNDMSTDNTKDVVCEFINRNKLNDKINVITR